MAEPDYPFLYKARECLTGAEAAFSNGRHDNVANRCYYACFQAAIVALQRAGIQPRGGEWGHEFVPAEFEGRLIYRRKLHSTDLRGILERNYALRRTADYDEDLVSRTEAERALRRTRLFVETIERGSQR